MWPRELIAFVTITSTLTAGVVRAAAVGPDISDYEILSETTDNDDSEGAGDTLGSRREVRCYCNKPECVPQGYMCRGSGCFTELPRGSSAVPSSLVRPEHSVNNGCLGERFDEKQCGPGFLCCGHDLCNHVDSPAMISRLNKSLQVLVGDQRAFLGPLDPTEPTTRSTDGWFKTATIAVPICGLVVLLILASLAIRLLQPMPTQGDKLGPHRTPDSAPPLLGPPKVPLV